VKAVKSVFGEIREQYAIRGDSGAVGGRSILFLSKRLN